MASDRTSMSQAGERLSLLDEWRAEVGDDEVIRIIRQTREDADSGRLPSFTDKESLLAYWRQISPPAE